MQIDLRVAKIPLIGWLAVHYWFVVMDGEKEQRWEIWQTSGLVSSSWGHLHLNLMKPTNGVGNGASWCDAQWIGEDAQNLNSIIQQSPLIYPYNNIYRYYPGPNSNTYIQWVLDKAEINYTLSFKGLGKFYHRSLIFNNR